MTTDTHTQLPKISVITPCLNAEQYIAQAIQSVIDQHYPNFEHIIVDGQSADGTLEILRKHQHLKWQSEPDSGQSNAMNKGFARSAGDLIVYLNADDYFLPEAFHTVAQRYLAGERFIVGDVHVVYQDGSIKCVRPKVDHRQMMHHWERWKPVDDIYISPFPNNPVQYFYARDIQQNQPFNEANHNTMDLEFLLRVSKQEPLSHAPQALGAYRLLDQAKNIQSQADPLNYWSNRNFSYLDELITDWTPSELIAFKNAQASGYKAEGNLHAFMHVNQPLNTLINCSLARNPLEKYRNYKTLISSLRNYADKLEEQNNYG